jgi:hypothetical protein
MSQTEVVRQFRSDSAEARHGAMRSFVKSGTLPPEIRPDLARLFEQGPPWDSDLVLLIARHPDPEFEAPYQTLLAAGNGAEQSLALQYLNLWLAERGPEFVETIRPKVESLTASPNPWIAFLAAVQRARWFAGGAEAWDLAARAVAEADARGFPHGIRSQAEELVTPEDIAQINEHLGRIGAKPLGAPAAPFPWIRKS